MGRTNRATLVALLKEMKPFEQCSTAWAVWQLFSSLGLIVFFSFLSLHHLEVLIIAVGFVRIMAIQHDCGHFAFLKNRSANRWVGAACSLFTLSPHYSFWIRSHALHHRSSGNFSRKKEDDLPYFSFEEYMLWSEKKKRIMGIVRNRLVFLLIISPLRFFFIMRFTPARQWQGDHANKARSVLLTNISLAVFYGIFFYFAGGSAIVRFISGMILSQIIIVLYFTQSHSFENSYLAGEKEWDFYDAAMKGSSYIQLPRWAEFILCNANYHHIHHLNVNIPNYRMRACYHAIPHLQTLKPIPFSEIFASPEKFLFDSKSSTGFFKPSEL